MHHLGAIANKGLVWRALKKYKVMGKSSKQSFKGLNSYIASLSILFFILLPLDTLRFVEHDVRIFVELLTVKAATVRFGLINLISFPGSSAMNCLRVGFLLATNRRKIYILII